jgi:hypothetical protein
MKLRRRLYSLVALVLLFVLLARVDYRTLFLLPLGLMAVQWYFTGTLFLVSVGAFLVYTHMGGLYGLSVMVLAVLSIEMGYLDREMAPKEHYAILLAAVLLSYPTYLLMASLSPVLPRLEVTALAALLIVVLYLFARLATD